MTKDVTDRTNSISEKVKRILNKRPFLVNALLQNIVNYTALARYIKKEFTTKASTEAIKISLIRQKASLKNQNVLNEEKILKLLENSKIELRDKIAVVITSKTLDINYIASSFITNGFLRHNIYVTDQKGLELKEGNYTKLTKNLVALIIKSPKELENLPGVVAFITQLLVSHGINIKEFISCYTDTVIILTREDGLKAFNLLQKYV